jgi:ketosteroid isomerase-like protein
MGRLDHTPKSNLPVRILFNGPHLGSIALGQYITPGADPRTIIARYNEAFSDNDLDGAMTYFAADAVYVLHFGETVHAFGGEKRGKAAIRETLQKFRDHFDLILYRPFPMIAEGGVVRGQVEFISRHRVSGEDLSGRFRLVWTVADGLIVRCEEYHDAARVTAFMRLFGKTD